MRLQEPHDTQDGGHDGPLLAKAVVQGRRSLDMADEEGGTAGEGSGRLRSRH